MPMIRIFYQLIVLYLSLHLLWHLFHQKKPWSQAATALVLTLFLLRLFLVK
jgi:hypothetical protein